ncbi:acyl-CoA thioesterase [Pseudovibrio sp. SCP19]|uniref:acyl-CoA thioesterase n=1 Tax=Pseudovibrio sp. SCP19 TaxID=3141374 RepID=UPI0033378181
MASLETLLSFVNTWECDENDHLNVQFYFSKFEEADRQFRMLTGFSEALVGARRVRHVRYHAELVAASLITVKSYVAFDGPHMLSVVHEMIEGSTGEICATAIDGYTPNPSSAKQLRARFKDVEENISKPAVPRGISPSPFSGKPTVDDLLKSGAMITGRSTVLPRHLNAEQKAEDAFALSCFSDAAAHVWERTPMNTAWLDENEYGRVALEQKLSWISPLKLGDMVQVISTLTSVQENTFTIRHHLFEARTKRLAAVCDQVSISMDLNSRKTVPLTEDFRSALVALQSQ